MEIDYIHVLQLLDGKDAGKNVIVLDARLHADYARGCLPNAINVPVNASTDLRHSVLERISQDATVLVYCQSDSCEWSDLLASYISLRRNSHIYVYRGGYRDWQ